ncbi:TetR family transcriptional regulator [Amycolatopsis umgeniensis]|uniref:AcrR family transcriptional regulator n=1 Tax=Amycolatopsis umgeniensis TaxID=336628 RepID=A0A841AWH2_9PSEU|nr:TetR family transcriptional regulator [Amycolatopsis umgeniensis]MBB5850644.1 AcrR family transcriptional regulator [Amycolatopsis umgeniensis]
MTRREPLNREKVLDAALALAAEEGLKGLSMRKLAKTLGVEAMALYNHVQNKTDILDGIAERVYSGIERADADSPWPERIRVTALNIYRALARHPVVPMALATDEANPDSLRALQPLDDLIGALYEAGFDDGGVRQTLGALNSLIFGSLLLTTVGFTMPRRGEAEQEQAELYLRRVDPAVLPNFSRAIPALKAVDPERDFARALDLLISGLVSAATSEPGTA